MKHNKAILSLLSLLISLFVSVEVFANPSDIKIVLYIMRKVENLNMLFV